MEGNYILLNSYPWKELHKFFNSTIMINCDEKILEKRLIERWENFNLPKEEIDKKVYENDHVLAFHDISPQKKIHVLVIPKGEYVDLNDFNNKASDKEIVELIKAITNVSNLLGVKDKGYRTLTNIGIDGGQEVPHLHFHIFAGEKIGKMVN